MKNSNENKIVTRFAPSPTGHLHIGGVRTALYNYLFARHNNGKYILRIEDTDKERSKTEFEESILESFDWLGLTHDEFHRQSEYCPRHTFYIKKMVSDGTAYVSKEESKDGTGEREVIRFKNPNKKISFNDLIVGDVVVDTTDLGDFVIAKDFDTPIFHLANVVDDFEMGVTHIIRAQEHLSNTPRQILIGEAIGAPRFTYAHIPLVLAPDKTKLSKRHGAVSALDFRDVGYLPEAVLNFMVLIGWNPGTPEEIFTLDELVKIFDLSKVQKSSGVFNIEKLNWINREHIKRLDDKRCDEMIEKFMPERILNNTSYRDVVSKARPVIIEHIDKFGDIKEMADNGEFDFYFSSPEIQIEKLFWKMEINDENKAKVMNHFKYIKNALEQIDDFNPENIKNAIWEYAEAEGRGNVLWPFRYALSGRDKSPDPFTIASIIGLNETIKRIDLAIQKLD